MLMKKLNEENKNPINLEILTNNSNLPITKDT